MELCRPLPNRSVITPLPGRSRVARAGLRASVPRGYVRPSFPRLASPKHSSLVPFRRSTRVGAVLPLGEAVDRDGFEPTTLCLQNRRSTIGANSPCTEKDSNLRSAVCKAAAFATKLPVRSEPET